MKKTRRLSTLKAMAALAVAAFSAFTADARTAAELFVDAPPQVLPLLERNSRLDMLDYFRSHLPTPTDNTLGGSSRVLRESDACIELQLSRDASMSIALVPLKADTLVAVIETVLTPVADSGVRFYRTDWTPVQRQPAMPSAADFMPKGEKLPKGTEMPAALYIRADYDPVSGRFTFVNTTAGYYTDTDRPAGLALLRSAVDMVYDGKRFVKPKQ
ncbi:MAG: DUF3256 family protein [Muribaculaceae bacterium]|nr:DUF3256 family protein [Muribaculaceae bacterium]